MKKFIVFVLKVEGHFYNVLVVNRQLADAENKRKDSTLPLTCFLVPDSQGNEGQRQSGWKENVTEGMHFFLNIAHGYHQDLFMKKEGWEGLDKITDINETMFGKMKDKLPFGKNCKQIWLPNGCLLEQGDAFSCGFLQQL